MSFTTDSEAEIRRSNSITNCIRSHIAWLTLLSREGGGVTGGEDTVPWAFVPIERTVHLLFPEAPHPDHLAAAVQSADSLGAVSCALWSKVDAQRNYLTPLGFEPAWQPCWMIAESSDVPAVASSRVTLVQRARHHDAARAALLERQDVLLAEAVVDGQYAGRAWMHLHGEIAGLYDMEVWQGFRRRGLGRELLGILSAKAAKRGARRITLNATPDGVDLYRACGFRVLGMGRTWWRHRHPGSSD